MHLVVSAFGMEMVVVVKHKRHTYRNPNNQQSRNREGFSMIHKGQSKGRWSANTFTSQYLISKIHPVLLYYFVTGEVVWSYVR